MANQNNYYAYNIIDEIYYGSPKGEEMIDIYGKQYNRRNEYNNLTPEEKENFEQEEKEFIQAVINKYVTGNNKNISYIGKYEANNNVSYTYINPNAYMPIQLSNMISNINGMHLYKLISAKDIDFDNIVLPNSSITRDYNWGIFDEKRRWGNKPIHINNTFELLNVIDYLLCACNNIWSELHKLKYKEEDSTNIWFVVKADSPLMILESKKISGDDFKRENIGKNEIKLLTTLDTSSFYSTVKTINNGLFGFGTNFHKTETDTNDLYFQNRILNTKASKNIIMGNIDFETLVNQPNASTSQTINGELYTIYGYKIGNDLKIYPGERIKSFINESCLIYNQKDIENIVDFNKKQLKYDTYFRINTDEYKEIHIEFLYNYNKNLHSIVKHPFILYYINNSNKKQILYVHPITDEESYSLNSTFSNRGKLSSEQSILSDLQNKPDYDVTYLYNINTNENIDKIFRFKDTDGIFVKDLNVKVIKESEESTDYIYTPIFYIIPDEYSLDLEITLPKTNTTKSITIYYYKNENIINGNIYIKKDKDHIVTNEELQNIGNNDIFTEIFKNIDINQQLSISYCLERFNIPENNDVYIKLNATYIALGNDDNDEINNPLHLKLSDEYNDIALYTNNLKSEDITDNFARSYYYYDNISNTNEYKRNFINYNSSQFFKDNVTKYINYDLTGSSFYHVWEKINNPYKASYTIINNSLINQEISIDDVNTEINNIHLEQLSYNLFKFNHTLNDIEQLKFDIDFKIDETSKVKKCQYKFPLNINKIYQPSINYIGEEIILKEIEQYDKYNNYDILSINHKLYSNQTLSSIYKDIGSKKYIDNNKISYTNIIKELNGYDSYNLSDPLTYDNTDDINKIFNISYDNANNIVNLLGSLYTNKKLNLNTQNSNSFKSAEIKIKDKEILTNSSIFNINGFGKNYRLHGYDNYINLLLFRDNMSIVSSYFDVLSLQTLNINNSINNYLNIKLEENADSYQYQLSYISYSLNNNEYEWSKYDNDFKEGININNDYIIKTIPIDIVKSTYTMNVHSMHDYDLNDTNKQITYYIPISYMVINSSTFYPPLDTIPNGQYDLNTIEDRNKYEDYVKCWNNNNNYRPITLSLKLFENSNNNNPYFNESNEAKMKFNILRSDKLVDNGNLSIDGKRDVMFISLNSRYYISDFIKYDSGNIFPCGSYFYYDEKKHSYLINEIFNNQKSNYINNNNILKHFNNIEDDRKKFLYPIFKKYKNVDNNNQYQYIYDIYKVSDINKLTIKNDNTKPIVTISQNGSENTETDTSLDNFINIDFVLSYIDFKSDNINEIESINEGLGNTEFGQFKLKIPISENLYSSKNYISPNIQTQQGGYKVTQILPIYRIKDSNNEFALEKSTLYPTITLNDITYEFFEFKYDDIYLLSYNKNNESISIENVDLFEKSDNEEELSEENLQRYYLNQLNYFLNYENNNCSYLLCNNITKNSLLN